jgi:molecular chaperone DnaK
LNPWVREAVGDELGCQLEFSIDPVTVVARGAAIFASTQPLPEIGWDDIPSGTWRIEIEHQPVGNIQDPDIGGRVTGPDGASVEGYTIELVDAKTQWRSGRITLAADGVFMTQLYAENQRRHRYDIELYDTTGSRIDTHPEYVSYTLGCVPENPPAAMTIGVGLSNGSVATSVKKGTKLPARKSMDHYTVLHLQSGNEKDQLRIPLLEGEHSRAARNHGIGAMVISGADISRDLPAGSLIEITVIMDEQQRVRLQAYVPSLDMDIPEVPFNPQMLHSSLDELVEEADLQKKRLQEARTEARRTEAQEAEDRLTQIDELEQQIDRSIEAAKDDADAIAEVDRKLRELGARIDEVEDSIEWPKMLEEAEESRADAQHIVEEYGKSADKSRLQELENTLRQAFDSMDAELLRRCIDDLDILRIDVLNKQPGFHLARFDWLVEQKETMRDTAQAEQIISLGRRALGNNDIEALLAANRQLLSLLPEVKREESLHVNIGTTNVMR